MTINLGKGIDKLLFGMEQRDVSAIYGDPDKAFDDEDGNRIWMYYDSKLRLTFYEDAGMKLGYIISANRNLTLLDQIVIGKHADEVKPRLGSKLKSWEQESFDITVRHYNEDNWLTFEAEFNEIVKVELGAMINNDDEFVWAYKAKK